MNRTFSIFPRGSAGVGLLALRAALIPVLCGPLFSPNVRIGLSALALLLAAGLLTRMASTIVAGITLAVSLWTYWNGGLATYSSLQVYGLILGVTATLALVGPGGYSVDAHLFGWQELTMRTAGPTGRGSP